MKHEILEAQQDAKAYPLRVVRQPISQEEFASRMAEMAREEMARNGMRVGGMPGDASPVKERKSKHWDTMLDLLRERGPMTRQEISDEMGIAKATVRAVGIAYEREGIAVQRKGPCQNIFLHLVDDDA